MKLPKNCKIELCASVDRSRSSITEPYLDTTIEGEHRIVATDGRMMAIIPVETNEHDASGYVSGEALAAARKTVRKGEVSEVTCNGALAITNGPTFTRPTSEKMGKYPDWRICLPKMATEEQTVVRVAIDVALLKALCDALGTRGATLEIVVEKKGAVLSPLTIRPAAAAGEKPAVESAFGVLMPMRLS